jgi:excisionase family DNA binding protein
MATKHSMPEVYTIQQSAELAGVTTQTIRRRISDRTLKAYRVGPRAIRVDAQSLLEMLRPMDGVA